MGGAIGDYGFSSASEAQTFATTLWNLFGEGTSDTRPFGSSVVDGFDLGLFSLKCSLTWKISRINNQTFTQTLFPLAERCLRVGRNSISSPAHPSKLLEIMNRLTFVQMRFPGCFPWSGLGHFFFRVYPHPKLANVSSMVFVQVKCDTTTGELTQSSFIIILLAVSREVVSTTTPGQVGLPHQPTKTSKFSLVCQGPRQQQDPDISQLTLLKRSLGL